MVSMGTEPGGGVLAGSPQQMWPVQGWRGAAGGAAPGGRALGRGRPGRTRAHARDRGSATSRRPPRFPPPRGARTGHSSLSFCSLPGRAQPAPAPSQPVASRKAPVFAETRALGTGPPPPSHGSSPPASERVLYKVCPTGPWTVPPVPFLRPELAP